MRSVAGFAIVFWLFFSLFGGNCGPAVCLYEPCGPDFSITANPASVTSNAGAAATSKITVSPFNGFSSTVSLAASGTPAGASASFSPTNVAGNGSETTLTLQPGTAAAGTYYLTVTGYSAGLNRTATVAWTIQ